MSQGVATRGLHLFRRGSCAALHDLSLEWFFQAQLACHNTWRSFEWGLKGNPFLVVHALPITLPLDTRFYPPLVYLHRGLLPSTEGVSLRTSVPIHNLTRVLTLKPFIYHYADNWYVHPHPQSPKSEGPVDHGACTGYTTSSGMATIVPP